MSQEPFPGYGQGGGEPLRPGSGMGNGARDAGGSYDTSGIRDQTTGRADDFDQDAYLDRLVAAADAGRIEIPAIPGPDAGQGLTISLAEVSDPAAADLSGFAQGGPADTMVPGTALLALAEAASADGALGKLTDNQVLGLAGAGKRLAALGTWIELSAAGEFAGRRVSGDKPGTVAGRDLTEFAGDELAPELGMTPFAAACHLGYARDVARRLPITFAALRAGRIDGYRVKIIAEATQWLSDEDAAEADQVLAVSAAQLTYGRLRNAAARLVLMLDPEAARRRKDAAASQARVTCFREEAGTAGLSGRDLPSAETLASWSHVKARALAYRAAGMPGTISALRARAFLDLLQEHDSRDAPEPDPPDSARASHGHTEDADSGETGGTDTVGTDTVGTHTDGTHTDGTHTDGTHTDGTHTDGTHTVGTDTVGTHTVGTDTVGTDTDGTDTDGTHTDGTHTVGADWRGADETRSDRTDQVAGADGGIDPDYRTEPDDGSGTDGGSGTDDGSGTDGNGGTDGGGGTDGDGPHRGGGTGPRPAPGGPATPGGTARDNGQAPVAALINITVTDATLAGTSQAPGEVAGFGLMDAASIRDLAAMASRNPATRWCVTVIGPDGTAAAHGCVPGQHRYDPDQFLAGGGSGGSRDGPAQCRDGPAHNRDGSARDRDEPPEAGETGPAADFLRRREVQLTPIAKGACDHAGYEPGYRPSRKLRHLIRARTVRCHFRGCSQPAADCDADHTVPWPAGPTCQCNLGPPCRHHHRCKQDPGWTLEQTEPGVMVWTGPSGRRHSTLPTIYPT